MTDVILPEGWVEARFGDVLLSISNGISEKQNQERKGIPVTRIETISSGKVDFQKIGYVENIKRNTIDRYQLKYGDILFSHINSPKHLGKTALFTDSEELYHGTNLLRLICNKKIVFPMIFHYFCQLLRGKGDFIAYAQHAVNQSSLNQKKILQFVFILPPLTEQEEIAQRVDRAIGHVDELKSRLETLLTTLKTFRQSVLNAAVTGKLTENWREENDFVIFQSFDNTNKIKKFREKVLTILPLNWSWLDFLSTAEIAPNLQDPCLTPDDIHIAPNHIESKTGRLLQYSTVKQDKVFSAKHRFNKGQILYSKIRPYLCKVIIANVSGLCSADMYPINAKINVVYLYYWMLSDEFTNWASTAESRSVLPKINQKDLNKIPVPTPPLEEQEEIVKRVEAYFALADQIEKQVQSALDKVNLLTQSILAKAFRGELTKEWRKKNPELISGENSAEALLKRIKAEKDALEKPSKKTKNTKVQTGFFN